MCEAFSPASPADLLAITMTASSSRSLRQSVAVPPASAGSCACASGNLVLYEVSYGNSATPPDLQICQRQRRAFAREGLFRDLPGECKIAI
jgi:hypothetical protein